MQIQMYSNYFNQNILHIIKKKQLLFLAPFLFNPQKIKWTVNTEQQQSVLNSQILQSVNLLSGQLKLCKTLINKYLKTAFSATSLV